MDSAVLRFAQPAPEASPAAVLNAEPPADTAASATCVAQLPEPAESPALEPPESTAPESVAPPSTAEAAREEPAAPAPPGLDEPMIVFAYACLRRQFAELRSHRPADGKQPDPEAVHRMRIATRRLRVGLRLFRRMLPRDSAKAFGREFRWFAQTLGEARDLDVYTENYHHYAQLIPPEQQAELAGYEQYLQHARSEARERLSALFDAPRCTALLESFAALLEDAPSTGALRRWRSFRIGDGAAKYLKKSMRRVRKSGGKIDATTDPEQLHKLRIMAKRLRYELEFFAPVLPGLGKGISATKQLQETLGEHQDACTASARLREYAKSSPASAGPAAEPGALDRLLANQEHRAADARRRFATEWQRFERAIDRVKLDESAA